VLKAEHIRWARQLVEASDAIVVGELSTLLSDDVLEAQRLRVLDVLTRLLSGKLELRNEQQRRLAKEHGVVTRRQLMYHAKLDKKAFDAAVATLLGMGLIGTGKASEQGVSVEEGNDPVLFWLPEDDDEGV
jgi:hypothetical protein